MSGNVPLYHKALLAWQDELEKQYKATLEDKQSKLRDKFLKKLTEMFGPAHVIVVDDEGSSNDLILGAEIEGLRFLAFRTPQGDIKVVLLVTCSRCYHQMPSAPLTTLADLGKELTTLSMSGTLSNHECSAEHE